MLCRASDKRDPKTIAATHLSCSKNDDELTHLKGKLVALWYGTLARCASILSLLYHLL